MSTKPVFRVWLGWRASHLLQPDPKPEADGWTKFLGHLREVFIPATWNVMGNFELLAYVPSVLNEHQAADLPDETALLVYKNEKEYTSGSFDTVAGRAYGLLHSAVFGKQPPRVSRSAWAVAPGAAPSPKLNVWIWAAEQGGACIADGAAAVAYLVLRHPTQSPLAPEQVHKALGAPPGDTVICRVQDLSFVWVGMNKGSTADALSRQVLAHQPAWTVEAAHDASGPRPSSTPPESIELRSGETLRYTK